MMGKEDYIPDYLGILPPKPKIMEKEGTITLHLKRQIYYDDATIGSLEMLDGSTCMTIERKLGREYRTQAQKVSQCLPFGVYKVKFDPSEAKYNFMLFALGFYRHAKFDHKKTWRNVRPGTILLCYDRGGDEGRLPVDDSEALEDFCDSIYEGLSDGRVKIQPSGITNILLSIEESNEWFSDMRTK